MLAFVTCRAFGIAGLPRIERDSTKEQIDLDAECEQVESSRVLGGLTSLLSDLGSPADDGREE
jgi:hypothetical protein